MTQAQRIIEFIREHGSITPMDGFELGITRLAARVNEMRNNGVQIVTETVHGVNRFGDPVRYARYTIPGGVPGCFRA